MIFQDTKGNEWDVRLNMGILEEIDNIIPDFTSEIVRDVEKLINLLWHDNRKVVMMLWVILEDQCKERSISPKDFARLFDRDVLNKAVDCLVSEFVSFFQYGPIGEKIRKEMPELMAKFHKTVNQMMDQKIKEASLKLDMPLPESQGSIQNH